MKSLRRNRVILKVLQRRVLTSKFSVIFIFVITGIVSTLWFLVRVIPKPQRAGYPCMKAAAPIMSGFILYILSIGGITLFFKKFVLNMKKAKYGLATVSLVASLVLLLVFNIHEVEKVYSRTVGFTRGVLPDGANNPMGTGFGINPGRVVWAWNPAATNENCKNVIVTTGSWGNTVLDWAKSDTFFQPKNNNQDTINKMADDAIQALANQATVKDAWSALFNNFNERKTGTASDYVAGQKIFIKVNNGQAGWAINNSDFSEKGTTSATGVKNAAMANTTPATVVAILKQLVDEVGVAQGDIYVGEPMTHVYKSLSDAIHDAYPNVNVVDKESTLEGRKKTTGWTADAIKYSDKGSDMPNGIKDALMNEMYNADYLISIPALKAHARGGVTLTAKLHFGSHGDHGNNDWGSFTLHDGLICTVDNDVMTSGVRGDYGMYRVLTDLMGHEKLGGNTILYVLDGLWGGIEATDMPVKWKTEPFNNDFPNSLFLAQDPVALESVCIDFLRAEANINTAFKDRPFFPAVDDHLHQAADVANWAEGITYDPEGDGTPMGSLGVHEHWNNDNDREYTRNLSVDGIGIELFPVFKYTSTVGIQNQMSSSNLNLFPNPCTDVTTLSFTLNQSANVLITVHSLDGKTVKNFSENQWAAGTHNQKLDISDLNQGLYLCTFNITTGMAREKHAIKFEVR